MLSADSVTSALATARAGLPRLDEGRCLVFGHLLAVIDAARAELRSQLAKDGLTELGFVVLNTMRGASERWVAPSVIAGATGILRGTLSDVLMRLEMSGLIARRRSTEDRRLFQAALTPAGRERCGDAAARYVTVIDEMMARVKPAALTSLDQSLQEISRSVNALSGPSVFPSHET